MRPWQLHKRCAASATGRISGDRRPGNSGRCGSGHVHGLALGENSKLGLDMTVIVKWCE